MNFMKITVFGSGYVGLVVAACLAEVGNDVIGVDIDESKVDQLNKGQVSIYESGLSELIQSCIKANRLRFTANVKEAVEKGYILFIAVGTPQDEAGSADLQYVLNVAKSIGTHMQGDKIII